MRRPREVIVLYDDRSARVTKLAMNLLPVLKHPLSRRNIRWWASNPQMYRKVITIGLQKKLCPTSGNSTHLPYDGYSSYYQRVLSQGIEPVSLEAFQEEEAQGLAESLEAILEKL